MKEATAIHRIFLASAAFLTQGCITADDLEDVPPDTPITLHPAASEVLGRQTQAVLVETEDTLADFPLEAQRIREVSQRASQAVVSVYVKTSTAARLRLLPFRIPGTGFRVSIPGEGLGSGFFIHPAGYILTNHHVIRDATDIFVQTNTGEDYGVTVIAEDPVYDLALLKVRAGGLEFAALPMGLSDLLDVGEMVIAVGNPLGLGHTVTQGIISQTGRNLAPVQVEGGRQVEYLQTDTAINPGSSGGPLITLTGAWIGVNTAGYTQAQGISFAVPSRQAREFLFNVLAGNGVRHP